MKSSKSDTVARGLVRMFTQLGTNLSALGDLYVPEEESTLGAAAYAAAGAPFLPGNSFVGGRLASSSFASASSFFSSAVKGLIEVTSLTLKRFDSLKMLFIPIFT